MKVGFVSAICDDFTFEEMMSTASELGFSCVEVACWPKGDKERRYAGVSHIDVYDQSEEYINYLKDYSKKMQIDYSSLAYYPNPMDGDIERSTQVISHLKQVISMAHQLGVQVVTTFIGRDQYKSVEENLKLFEKIWTPIIQFAEEKGVRIAIENCPMLFDEGQWPGGQNLATTPVIWREMFKRIPSKYLGLNYDPSHFIWLQMDYLSPLEEFKEKIFHVHFKDILVDRKKLSEAGIMSYPLDYMSPRLPGRGEVNWNQFVKKLKDIDYASYACIEVEDKEFEGTRDKVIEALKISKDRIEKEMKGVS